MTDICIPITHLEENQIADVTVSLGGVKKEYNFRIEAFPWNPAASSDERVNVLRQMIEKYDNSWEIIQIYNPGSASGHVHVLFRKKL